MLKVRNERFDLLYDRKISHEHQIKFCPMEEGKKISIMSDTMFKAMFYNENRIKYSSKLISYYLDVSYEDLLSNLVLSKGELDKEKEFDKGERSDYVASFNGTSINIEINKNDSLKVLNRNMEYAHRLLSKKIKRGSKNDYQYTQVIQFNINNFSFEGIDKIVDVYAPRNKEGIILDDKIIFIQIYIPNLIKKWYTEGIESLSEAEKFLAVLVESDIKTSYDLGGGFNFMKEYIEEAKEASNDLDTLEAYDKEWALKDQALRDGYQEGFDIGIEKGIKQGIERGIKQKEKEIVINMLKKDIAINTIAEITKLSINEINILKESADN